METRTIRSRKFKDVFPSIQNSAPYHTRPSFIDENPTYKRFGTYFTLDANLPKKEVNVVLGSGSASEASSSSSLSTPAEEIVKTYRARSAVQLQTFDVEASLNNDLPVKELQPRFRQSRYDALCDKMKEAERFLGEQPRGANGRITCPRTGCKDTLPTVEALARHLHIHDLEPQDSLIFCSRCNTAYKNEGPGLNKHKCRRSASSRLPFKDRFQKLFLKWQF